jgi:hypothetical protein
MLTLNLQPISVQIMSSRRRRLKNSEDNLTFCLPEAALAQIRNELINMGCWSEENGTLSLATLHTKWQSNSRLKRKPVLSSQTIKNVLNNSRGERGVLDRLILLLFNQSFDDWCNSLPEDARPYRANSSQSLRPSQASGFVKIHRTLHPDSLIPRLLEEATTDLWLFSTSLEVSLNARTREFANIIKKGVTVYILIFDPTSDRIECLANELDAQSADTVRSQCETSLRFIVDIQNLLDKESPKSLKHYKVKITSNFPRISAFIADSEQKSGTSFIVPTINNRPGNLPVLEFKNVPNGLASIYFSGIKMEWEKSITLEQFLRDHPNYPSQRPGIP